MTNEEEATSGAEKTTYPWEIEWQKQHDAENAVKAAMQRLTKKSARERVVRKIYEQQFQMDPVELEVMDLMVSLLKKIPKNQERFLRTIYKDIIKSIEAEAFGAEDDGDNYD